MNEPRPKRVVLGNGMAGIRTVEKLLKIDCRLEDIPPPGARGYVDGLVELDA